MILTAPCHCRSSLDTSISTSTDLGLHPGDLSRSASSSIKWYSLAYIAGILVGWWYLLKLLAQPGAPMARRHADDLVFYATLGIILGGRIGYVIFYAPEMFLHPLQIFKLWDGGMSFHGGVIGTSLGDHPVRAAAGAQLAAHPRLSSPAACRSGCSSGGSPIS